jgi:hypothetical protein
MLPFQQRVVDEKRELSEKLDKLMTFIRGPMFANVDPAEQERLTRQSKLMDEYAGVLAERISEFK